MADKSRAEYFKERRSKYKYFSVEVDREKMEKLENYLDESNLTKREWFSAMLDEIFGEKE